MDVLLRKEFYRGVDKYSKDCKLSPIIKTLRGFRLSSLNWLSLINILLLKGSKFVSLKVYIMFTYGLFVKLHFLCLESLKLRPMMTSSKIQCGFPFSFCPIKTISSLSSLHMGINGRKYHSPTRP